MSVLSSSATNDFPLQNVSSKRPQAQILTAILHGQNIIHIGRNIQSYVNTVFSVGGFSIVSAFKVYLPRVHLAKPFLKEKPARSGSSVSPERS